MTRRLTASRSPTLEEVLRAGMDARLADVHTWLPGRVETYDAATQKATVKPMVKDVVIGADGNEVSEDLPILQEVPVKFPRAGGFFLSFPVQPGDLVILLFAERSLDKYGGSTVSETSEAVDPIDPRMHDTSDAVAIPGFYPFPMGLQDANPQHGVFGKDGGAQVRVRNDGGVTLAKDAAGADAAAEAQCLATTLKGYLDKIEQFFTIFYPPPVGSWIVVPADGGLALQTAITAPSAFPSPPAAPVIESAHHKIDE